MRRQRLFFALWPDARIRKALARLTCALPRCRGRWVHELNLHITAAFVGAVDANVHDCLLARAATLDAEEFALVLTRIGYFPRSRILWLGADQCPPALTDLVRQLNSCLTVCGFKPGIKPYRPHMTLVRDASPASTDIQVAPVEWSVDSFCLVASQTLPQGARYEILRRYRLH